MPVMLRLARRDRRRGAEFLRLRLVRNSPRTLRAAPLSEKLRRRFADRLRFRAAFCAGVPKYLICFAESARRERLRRRLRAGFTSVRLRTTVATAVSPFSFPHHKAKGGQPPAPCPTLSKEPATSRLEACPVVLTPGS